MHPPHRLASELMDEELDQRETMFTVSSGVDVTPSRAATGVCTSFAFVILIPDAQFQSLEFEGLRVSKTPRSSLRTDSQLDSEEQERSWTKLGEQCV